MIHFDALDRYTEDELLSLAERCASRDEETAAVAEWALDLHDELATLRRQLAEAQRDRMALAVRAAMRSAQVETRTPEWLETLRKTGAL